MKADLAIYSLVVGMSGLWVNVATMLNNKLDFSRGPQQAEILDADAEIRAEILLESEIRNPKQYIYSDYFRKIPIISVKYGNNPINPIEISKSIN